MHDTDRTQLELETDSEDYEFEFESEFERESEPCRCHSQQGEVMDETEEMELAAELLEVTDEEELDQFLGKLIKRVGRKVKKFVRSPVGGVLLKALKGAALSAVPGLGPVMGAASLVGSALKGAPAEDKHEPTPEEASEIFGMELEGLSPQDQEFEVARRFVRFGAEAVAQAANAGAATPPGEATNQAMNQAAKRHAPGLNRRYRRGGQGGSNPQGGAGNSSGRWERRGRHIVLFNI